MVRKLREIAYEGDLAEPIRKVSDRAEMIAELIRRFNLLFPRYEIDPSDPDRYLKLLYALAMNHVPGLQLELRPHPGGRTREWTDQRLAQLALDIDEIKRKREISTDKEACSQISSGSYGRSWRPPERFRGTSEAWQTQLRNKLAKGRRTIVYRLKTRPLEVSELEKMFLGRQLPTTRSGNGSLLEALLKELPEDQS